MNIYKNYIAPFLQGFNTNQLALFVAILSMVFVVTLKDGTRCLSAQCVAGANEVMAGDITVKSGNPNGTTLKSTSTSDIDINLPGTAGTLLHSASTLGNDQFLQTNATGGIITGDIPALDIDDSTKVDTTGGNQGQILKIASAGGLEFANYEINETQFDSSNASTLGQFLRSNASNSLDFDTLELDDISLIGSPAQGDQVRVNASGELETFTASATVINESTFDSANGTLNQYLRVNGSSSLSYDTLELDDIGLIGSPAQGDQVRVNASGELETFTPSGGGAGLTRVAWGSGQKVRPSNTTTGNGFVICWNGSANGKTFTTSPTGVNIGSLPYALDEDKRYKLVWGFNNTTSYSQGYNPFIKYKGIETNCHNDSSGHELVGNQIFGTDQNISNMNHQHWYQPYNNYLNAYTSETAYNSNWGSMSSFKAESDSLGDTQGWCYPQGTSIPNYNSNYPLVMANNWVAEHDLSKIGMIPSNFGAHYFGMTQLAPSYSGGNFDSFGAIDEFTIRNVVGQKYPSNNYINNGTHWTSKGTCFHKKPNFEFRFLRGLYIESPSFNYAGYGTQGGANSSPTGDLYIEWSLYEYDEEY